MPDSSKNPSPLPLRPAAGPRPGSTPSRSPGSPSSRSPGSGVSRRTDSGASPRAAGRRAAGRRAPRHRPLPDAQAVRTRIVPDAAPPYDDATTAGASAQGETPAVRSAKVAIVVQSGDSADEQTGFARRTGRAQPAVLGRWPSQFAQILAETLAGSRPSRQLAPWTTEQARKRISELGPLFSGARHPRGRRVLISSPIQGVVEMTVIVDYGGRARALAVRLERPLLDAASPLPARAPDCGAYRRPQATANTWRCTSIEAA